MSQRYGWILVAAVVAMVASVRADTITPKETPNLVEALRQKPYRNAWNALFTGEKNVPTWLRRFARTNDGPVAPGHPVEIEGATYQVNNVCKTHDCGSNQFFVLFAPKGAHAWGLLYRPDADAADVNRFFGKPDAAKQAALVTASQS